VKRPRPINADIPPKPDPEPVEVEAPEAPAAKPEEQAALRPAPPEAAVKPKPVEPKAPVAKPEPKQELPLPPESRRRRRKPRPLTPKLLALLVVIAIGFIVLAVVGGRGGAKKDDTGAAPAPAPTPVETGGSTPAAQAPATEELGFPSFATNNTTRIGGSEAAANAAGAALAAFPSTTPDQRPAAVALVGEEDWAGAIAGAVLMAAPIQAPLLYSAPGEAPDVTTEALAALAPTGSSATGNAAAFLVGDVAAPGVGTVTEVKGGQPAAEAAAIAELRDQLFGSEPDQIVVASAEEPEFAAPAAAWAARSGDPVLFAEKEALPAPTKAALKVHKGVPVYVLGPSAVISSAVVREIAALGAEVKRVSGETPVANAIDFARFHDGDMGWNVNDPGHGFVLARADAPLDAAAVSALSASGTWGPLLLTDSAAKVPAELRSYLLDVKPGYTTNPTRAFYNHVWIVGDQEAIDVNQQAEVNELAELAKIGGGE
jgi:hypothetical protein